MSNRKAAVKGLVDNLLEAKPEISGDFFGAPSLVRQRWWTDTHCPIRLNAHRFIMPGRNMELTFTTLTRVISEPTPRQLGRLAWDTFIFSEDLTFSSVHVIDHAGVISQRAKNSLQNRRIERQHPATENEWGYFLHLLVDGFIFPEDPVEAEL